jgi:microcystin-dependent protein
MSLPALPVTADTRSITERVNVLIRDYNTMLRVPAGCVMPFAGATAPSSWLLCYGQAVSRTAYSDLFAAIGTTYGAGDGSTTFNLPDMRGRVAAGKDDMGGSAANRITSGGQAAINGTTLGATGGNQDNTLDTTRIPAHSHGYSDPGHTHAMLQGDTTPASFTGRAGEGDGNNNYFQNTTSSGVGITITNTGGGGAHNNTQPTIILNHIIST